MSSECSRQASTIIISILIALILAVSYSTANEESLQKGITECPEDMTYIPPGIFMMGCSKGDENCFNDEKPPREVEIINGLCMDKTEVTQGAYIEIMGENPSYFMNCGYSCPVETVTWDNAKAYCEKLGRRLPTEAEWEFAARGGSSKSFYVDVKQINKNSCNAPGLDLIAWYCGNSGVNYEDGWDCSHWDDKQYDANICGTHPVGEKQANEYGLYDMVGNAWEWVVDCWDKDWYSRMPPRNPVNTNNDCDNHVMRGGSWRDSDTYARVSMRNNSSYDDVIGFRCAKDL